MRPIDSVRRSTVWFYRTSACTLVLLLNMAYDKALHTVLNPLLLFAKSLVETFNFFIDTDKLRSLHEP